MNERLNNIPAFSSDPSPLSLISFVLVCTQVTHLLGQLPTLGPVTYYPNFFFSFGRTKGNSERDHGESWLVEWTGTVAVNEQWG